MLSFVYTGGQQTWDVPLGVTSLLVDAYGASGAKCTGGCSADGGLGGRVFATVPVTQGTTVYINIGGAGGTTTDSMGGFNGGGSCTASNPSYIAGGGGATDIRTSTAITTALVVAGTAASY